MMSDHMMWQCGLHFGVTWWQVLLVLCTIRMPLHPTWPRRGSHLSFCASALVGVNVLGRLPSSSGSSGPRWMSGGSTWHGSWLVLVVVLRLTACLMSNGGSSAQYATRKSSNLEGRRQWPAKRCMSPTKGKACGCG